MFWLWPAHRKSIQKYWSRGLALSIALMGLVSSFIAVLLNHYRWIAWVGLAIIVYVSIKTIYESFGVFLSQPIGRV
jgi:predicted tellurium resistance membrane protein TerC